MVIREKYLQKIRGFYDDDLIKIITGVRRCGKSIVLTQISDEIRKKTDNIVFLNFDDKAKTYNINTWKDIVDYVNEKRKETKCYVFLDEIQEIENWEIACKSLRNENCSVFITGSNSKLLSKEFTKELSGRYVAFNIRPFVYKEILEYANELNKKITEIDYLIYGGFPKRIEYDSEDDIRTYLFNINETIVVNDIINRYKIKKENEFKKFVNYVLLSNSRMYSALNISNVLKLQGTNITSMTVQKWVEYLCEAYVISEIKKFSKKAKSELEQSKKLYNIDVGLNSIRHMDNRYDLTHNMENVVYNELVYMGYQVYVYDNNGKEIDFLAIKNNKKYFVQVAYSVEEQKTYDREFAAFKNISYLDEKIIITNDDIDYSTSSIKHIRFKDFLRMEEI